MTGLSLNFRKAANASQTGELPIVLVTVTHPDDEGGPRRFSSDPTARLSIDPLRYGTVSRVDTYAFLPMSMLPPEDSDDTPPAIQLVISNLTRELMPLLRSVTTPATVSVEVVLKSAPDDVEQSWPAFDLTSASYVGADVTLGLTADALSAEPFPSGRFTPAGFGGLF